MKPHDSIRTPASSGRHPEAVRGIRMKALELASMARSRGIMCGKSDQEMLELAGLIEDFIGRGADEETKIRSWAMDMAMDNAGGRPIAARQMYGRAQRFFDYVYSSDSLSPGQQEPLSSAELKHPASDFQQFPASEVHSEQAESCSEPQSQPEAPLKSPEMFLHQASESSSHVCAKCMMDVAGSGGNAAASPFDGLTEDLYKQHFDAVLKVFRAIGNMEKTISTSMADFLRVQAARRIS